MAGTSSAPTSLKEYLKKYTTSDDKEKKKKKKKKVKSYVGGVLVVDEDPVWQKPVKPDEEEEDSADEEKPQVNEDIEVKRMRRLEQLRYKRPVGVISEDGSGWISVSDTPSAMNSEDQNTDISPPRKRRVRNDTPSPKSEQEADGPAGSDLSPPRQPHKHSQGDRTAPYEEASDRGRFLSPPRRQRRDEHSSVPEPGRILSRPKAMDSDISPPRRARHDSRYQDDSQQISKHSSVPEHGRISSRPKAMDSDISPPRRARHDPRYQDDSQQIGKHTSVPGKISSRSKAMDSDISPPRRARHDSRYQDDSQQIDKHSSVPEPGKISSRPKAIDSDMSPPRRARRHSRYQDDPRASSAADLSPPRKFKNERSSSIVSTRNSIHRLDDNNTVDAAPPASGFSPSRSRRKESPNSSHHPKTGLVSGRDIKAEIDKTKKEELLRFNALDPSVSGRGAEPIYRDPKTGERMSKEEFLNSRKKERKKDEKPKEIKLEWGKGLAQKRDAEARLQEIEVEKNKPFARSRDDPDLDSMLKERVRWGDPMAHLVKKKQLEPVLPDLGDSEKMKESGFIVPQEIPSHSWIRRGLDAAPNRYGIKPGRHWDGVDRSTGYEKDMFKRMNEKRATEKEAYLWSVSDM
ncbi:hypothetical protein CASFOL_005411 [Castilleja foliolosa]|uniref:BUD13 homolog n=1 Tax=Castilleja foliolosa TaxID=1961234 RepID=A0ABD3E3P1_9LAMI